MEVSPGFVFKKSLVACKSGHLGVEQPWRHFPPGAVQSGRRRSTARPGNEHLSDSDSNADGGCFSRSQQIRTNATEKGKLRREKFEAPVKCSNFWVPMLRLHHLGINPSGEWGFPDVILSHGGSTGHAKTFVPSDSVGDRKWAEFGVLECLKGRAEKVNDFDLISSVMSFVSRPLLWAYVSLQVCKAWASKKPDSNEFFLVKDLQTANLQVKQKKRR